MVGSPVGRQPVPSGALLSWPGRCRRVRRIALMRTRRGPASCQRRETLLSTRSLATRCPMVTTIGLPPGLASVGSGDRRHQSSSPAAYGLAREQAPAVPAMEDAMTQERGNSYPKLREVLGEEAFAELAQLVRKRMRPMRSGVAEMAARVVRPRLDARGRATLKDDEAPAAHEAGHCVGDAPAERHVRVEGDIHRMAEPRRGGAIAPHRLPRQPGSRPRPAAHEIRRPGLNRPDDAPSVRAGALSS